VNDREAEAMIGLAALSLSTNWATYRALVRGLAVPCRFLDPRPLKALGMTTRDGWLVLDLDRAVLIEASRPQGGYFAGRGERR
jgi:hypothetical protein